MSVCSVVQSTVVELGSVALPVGFHDLVHFVDLAVEAAGGDEPGQLPADGGRRVTQLTGT